MCQCSFGTVSARDLGYSGSLIRKALQERQASIGCKVSSMTSLQASFGVTGIVSIGQEGGIPGKSGSQNFCDCVILSL